MLNLHLQKFLEVAEREGWVILNLKVLPQPFAVPCALVETLNGSGDDIALGFDLNERYWPQQAQNVGQSYKRLRLDNSPVVDEVTDVTTTPIFNRKTDTDKDDNLYVEKKNTIVWCSIVAEVSHLAIRGIPAKKMRVTETVHLGMTLDEEFVQVFPVIPEEPKEQQ